MWWYRSNIYGKTLQYLQDSRFEPWPSALLLIALTSAPLPQLSFLKKFTFEGLSVLCNEVSYLFFIILMDKWHVVNDSI